MNPVFEALSLLTPYDIDLPKIRIGPEQDGGYIFADRLDPSQTILSYGISTEYTFDALMAARGHTVYMFDHTIDGIDATGPRMLWFKEGVTGTTDPRKKLYSIADHLQRFEVAGDRLILKMDVEGAEFGAINNTPVSVIGRFEQIAIEIHGIGSLEHAEYRERFVRMLTKLNNEFTLFHVHANTFDGHNGIKIVGGFPVCELLELSYIRTAAVRRTANRTLYPTPLDFPNMGGRDNLLWFYPFLPTAADFPDFAACQRRVDERNAKFEAWLDTQR